AEGFRRAIRAQEAERARIARELHDEAGQVLSAVALHLRALGEGMDEDERVVLEDLRGAVNEASVSLYELITELRPAALRKHGLASAIAHQATRTAQMADVDVRVAVDDLPLDLPEETQTALFRVVQEALTNVSRHSGARTAAVTARRQGDRLRVVIEDDGRGFDTADPSERHGLVGIRERVELLGGRLQVDSAPGRGTAVVVEIGVSG
ncbi:MAG TPA: sensor histidine kinase, partial [Miltoncostaeaceae bacterium]|nr:sensor histidine kinase [Miltoncostaeaceae bacterium]